MDEQVLTDIVKKEVLLWFKSQEGQTSGYEYEKTFVKCWQSVGQKIFQESLGIIPKSKNEKKKVKSSFGEVVVSKTHSMSETKNGFQMTPYLQDQVCYIGQNEVFEEGSETLFRLLQIEVSNKQIQRVSEHYGACLEQHTKKIIEEGSLLEHIETKSETYNYGMTDGSMVFTREEGWKEIKLGRVFNSNENIAVTEKRNEIKNSKYCAYLGNFAAFLQRFELLLKGMKNLVFIADGAKWFWEWASTYYPQAIQILDYYHAKEYLCEYAKLSFKENSQRAEWIKLQEDLLFKDKIDQVIVNIKNTKGLVGEALKGQQKIITYYENNRTRMLYGTYANKGLLIGSGPIESAHRNVIQKRLKLSGQRWSKQGAQKIANLRVVHKSDNWNQIIELAKTGKIAA